MARPDPGTQSPSALRREHVVPRWEPRDFVVDLLEDTGPLARDRAELLLSWLEWVEVEAVGEEDLLEGLRYLRGAVMKAAAVEL